MRGEKKSRDVHPRQPAKRIVDRSNLLRPLALEKLQWFRTDSGTSYRLSKSEAPLSCRKAHPKPKKYAKCRGESQQRKERYPQASTGTFERLRRGTMRRKATCNLVIRGACKTKNTHRRKGFDLPQKAKYRRLEKAWDVAAGGTRGRGGVRAGRWRGGSDFGHRISRD